MMLAYEAFVFFLLASLFSMIYVYVSVRTLCASLTVRTLCGRTFII